MNPIRWAVRRWADPILRAENDRLKGDIAAVVSRINALDARATVLLQKQARPGSGWKPSPDLQAAMDRQTVRRKAHTAAGDEEAADKRVRDQ
jgi:hypothetical protein